MSVFVIQGDALEQAKLFGRKQFDLIYIDPPFNTKDVQKLGENSYNDKHGNFESFLCPILKQLSEVLTDDGSLFVHLDYREVHYAKVWLDGIMGRAAFQGEIVWHFETGGLSKSRWTNKHNTILWYCKAKEPYFDFAAVPEQPRKAPKAGYEGAKKWSSVWNINVSTTDPERAGYPSQKPEELLGTLVRVHTRPGALCLDVFAGSGTLGAVCEQLGRHAVLVDSNPQAIEVTRRRLPQAEVQVPE